MGIVPLVSRRQLAGAAPSTRLRLRTPPESPSATPMPLNEPSNTVHDPSRPGPQGSPAADALRGALAPTPAPAAKPAAELSSSEPKTSAASATRFSLAVVAIGNRLWVEQLLEGVFAREQLELIGAMAAALIHPERHPERPELTQFDWPLHGNLQLDLGPEEAAASLASFINRQAEARGSVEIVALGATAAERLRALPLTCAQRALPATREMLEQPLLKRDAWTRLRA
ncbi:MAG: hypothetical protein AAGA95_02925 [Pseudomonadota bacterium]